jgi:hypothetical protein
LTLDSAGVLSGRPIFASAFSFKVEAKNSEGADTKELSLIITMSAFPVITSTTLPDCVYGLDYYQTIQVDGELPISWEIVSGTLPGWLALSKYNSYAAISGAGSQSVRENKTYKFALKASNSHGSDTREFSLKVRDPEMSAGCFNIGVGTAVMFFVSLGALGAPRLRRRKK